jgi:hypothetical protein
MVSPPLDELLVTLIVGDAADSMNTVQLLHPIEPASALTFATTAPLT